MKTLSKAILALCLMSLMSLFLLAPPATAQKASDPEIKQILSVAKTYAGSSLPVNKYEYKCIKKGQEYATVHIAPKPMLKRRIGEHEVVLKKIRGKWVVETMIDLEP
jgi:hypothetical protein